MNDCKRLNIMLCLSIKSQLNGQPSAIGRKLSCDWGPESSRRKKNNSTQQHKVNEPIHFVLNKLFISTVCLCIYFRVNYETSIPIGQYTYCAFNIYPALSASLPLPRLCRCDMNVSLMCTVHYTY